MEKTKLIPFEPDNVLTTDSLMKKMGITRDQANAILWDLFDKSIVDLVPVLEEEKMKDLRTQD
jgi:hypothetical protein